MHCQKASATENVEVAHIILNSNCLTLGLNPWGENVNLIVFVHPLGFFCSLLRPSGLEYHGMKAAMLPHAAHFDIALHLTSVKRIRNQADSGTKH